MTNHRHDRPKTAGQPQPRWATQNRGTMAELKKKIWKRVLKSQLISLVIIIISVTFIYVRSESLGATLTVGLSLFLASFRFTYPEYQQYKREVLEQESQKMQKRADTEIQPNQSTRPDR